jgi:fructose-1,6-bisphosphatase
MKAALSSNHSVVVLASEEDDAAIPCSSSSSDDGYAVVFDPLDGSRNIDAAIPTGACREPGFTVCKQHPSVSHHAVVLGALQCSGQG